MEITFTPEEERFRASLRHLDAAVPRPNRVQDRSRGEDGPTPAPVDGFANTPDTDPALPGNRDAQAILEKARQRKDSGPLVEVARQRAMMALDARKPAEARAAIDRIRSIDPDHPAIAQIEQRLDKQRGLIGAMAAGGAY